MINIIIVKALYGDAVINVDEISSIVPQNLSFMKCVIILKNKTTIDCTESPLTIYNKIQNL